LGGHNQLFRPFETVELPPIPDMNQTTKNNIELRDFFKNPPYPANKTIDPEIVKD
jgi:hypothetical protein